MLNVVHYRQGWAKKEHFLIFPHSPIFSFLFPFFFFSFPFSIN